MSYNSLSQSRVKQALVKLFKNPKPTDRKNTQQSQSRVKQALVKQVRLVFNNEYRWG